MTPKASIIVPVYKREGVLHVALESVLAQTEPDWECIVVDDASPTPATLPPQFARDPRFRLVHRTVNGGVAAAQQTGLQEARAPFVGFLHSDDKWLPGKLDEQLRAFASLGDEFAAVEGALLIANGSDVRRLPPALGVGPAGLLSHSVGVHVSGLLFRTTHLQQVGFDTTLRCYEDWDLFYRLTKRFRVHTIPAPSCTIHHDGDDRLSTSMWMVDALERLMVKHAVDLAGNLRARSTWWYKLARGYGVRGKRLRAVRALGHSVADDRSRWRRSVLIPAFALGRTPASWALAAYGKASPSPAGSDRRI